MLTRGLRFDLSDRSADKETATVLPLAFDFPLASTWETWTFLASLSKMPFGMLGRLCSMILTMLNTYVIQQAQTRQASIAANLISSSNDVIQGVAYLWW